MTTFNFREPGEFGDGATMTDVPGEGHTKGLSELLAKVQAASGADKALDRCILMWDRGFTRIESGIDSTGYRIYAWSGDKYHGEITDEPQPDYTASIDAALALVERVLPGWMVVNLCEWEAETLRQRGPWACLLKLRGTQDDFTAKKGREDHAPTAPLAILAATLQALIAGSKP